MMAKKAESKYEDHKHVISCLTKSQSAEKDQREAAREAILFVTKRDGQWEPEWWNNSSGKPRYTFDMCTPIVDQICGEMARADFDIRVNPAGGDATKDVALTYDGMIRNIENISRASEIYRQAELETVIGGFSAWRVIQAYADDDSFDQDLMLEKINNPVDRVWFDSSAEKRDKSDAKYVIILHAVSPEEYEDRWPEGAKMSVPDGREGEAYYDKAEVIVVGEILYGVETERELIQFSNGHVYPNDDKLQSVMDELARFGINETRRRIRKVTTFYSRFFDASDWLEDAKPTVFNLPPVVPVYGNFKLFENKTLYNGAIEKLYDPQRVMNYSLSREIEEGALAPRAKWWMTMAQAAGHEDSLATLNTNSDPVQFYNPDPQAPGAPQQTGGAQINPGLRTISESMRQIIGQSAGMFAANMGDNPGLQSGVAIDKLQEKGDNGSYKYFEAMEVAIAATGRILVKAIPKVYDTQRQVRVLYEDGTYEMAEINQSVIDNQTGQIITLNDLGQGVYDVVCSAGPAFQNRQKETLHMLIETAKVDPSILQIGGDVLLNNINSPAAKVLAERKRAQMLAQGMIPESEMTEDEKAQMAAKAQQPQQPDAAMVLAQAEMLKAQAEQLKAQNDQIKLQIDAAKVQIEQQKLQAGVQVDSAELGIKQFAAETGRMQAQIKAQEAGAKISKDTVQAEGIRLDNAKKVSEIMTPQF